MKTEDQILAKAVELFNQRGIEYVGLRELAAILGIRVGNITYYFATKDDLVNRISRELNAANELILRQAEDPGIFGFLDTFRLLFLNHLRYRCIALSLVHILNRNQSISKRFKKTQRTRSDYLAISLSSLATGGWLKWPGSEIPDTLVSNISLLARFWISDATITLPNHKQKDQLNHYLRLFIALLKPYLTAKGKKDLFRFQDDFQIMP